MQRHGHAVKPMREQERERERERETANDTEREKQSSRRRRSLIAEMNQSAARNAGPLESFLPFISSIDNQLKIQSGSRNK